MNEVHAVKDLDTVRLISHLLKIRFSPQVADVWDVGLNLALRISDLLAIRQMDIQGNRLYLREGKTGHQANILINDKAQAIIQRIRQEHPEHIYLFQSHRAPGSIKTAPKPLSRRYIARAFAEVGQEVNVHLGTHSMRKTRGYHLYQSTQDIGRVMKMLRHRSEDHTLRYIGLTQEVIDQDFAKLEI